MLDRRLRAHVILGVVTVGAALMVMSRPPIPQPPAYHLFADQRAFLGVPNFLDVVSNVLFLAVGAWGLLVVRRLPLGPTTLREAWERWPYVALFGGVALTAAGSIFYHLEPNNARLVWDRLPMTVGFMGLLAAMLAERVGIPFARRAFVPLLLLGAASVLYWYWTELRGAGDLRPYLLVQFGSLLLLPLVVVLHPARGPGARYLVAGLVSYAVAKGLEMADAAIFSAGHLVSGHTLKHLAAAAAVGCVVLMLKTRAAGGLAVVRRPSAVSRERGP